MVPEGIEDVAVEAVEADLVIEDVADVVAAVEVVVADSETEGEEAVRVVAVEVPQIVVVSNPNFPLFSEITLTHALTGFGDFQGKKQTF